MSRVSSNPNLSRVIIRDQPNTNSRVLVERRVIPPGPNLCPPPQQQQSRVLLQAQPQRVPPQLLYPQQPQQVIRHHPNIPPNFQQSHHNIQNPQFPQQHFYVQQTNPNNEGLKTPNFNQDEKKYELIDPLT